MKWGVKYARSRNVFATFVGPTDARDFLSMIRKGEPGVPFAAVDMQTGLDLDW